MIQKLGTMCLTAGFLASLVFAQTPPAERERGTPPDPQTMITMRVERLGTLLSLTADQKTRATAIFTNAYTSSQSIQSSAQSNRESLAEAVKKNDTAAIDQLSLMAGTLSGQLTAISSKAEAAFYAILTSDQKTKFDAMPHRGHGGGHRGPGGGFGPSRFAPPPRE